MYPIGSNGASQAILDARVITREILAHGATNAALVAYEAERRPATTDLVMLNRRNGPEQVMQMIEERAPDGYNWFFGAVHHTIAESLYARLPYSLERDFEPVTIAAFVPNVVVVHPKHKDRLKTLKDLIDYAKANPDKLNYGSAGSGTTHHLSVELFKTMTGTKLVHVPYKGAGPLMVDLLAGQVDLAFDGMGTSSVQIKAGKLIPLAITSAKRNAVLPNVPTVQEAGVPGYEVRTWYGIWAIKGTPAPIKERMYKEIVKAMEQPDLKRIWAEQGADAGGMPPAEMEKIVKAEIAKWAKVVKDAGAKVDN